MKIVYNRMGIGNNYGDCIQLHEDLKQPEYKLLHDYILKHELEHSPGGVTKHDMLHDIQDLLYKPKEVSKLYFKFYFRKFFRGAWWQSMPFTVHEGDVCWDLSKLWQWSLMFIVVGLLAWLLI